MLYYHHPVSRTWTPLLMFVLSCLTLFVEKVQGDVLTHGVSKEHSAEIGEQQRHLRSRRLDRRELEEGTRIFARYVGERGHQTALGCARSILKDDSSDGEILFTGNGFCMYELLKDPEVAEVTFDYQTFALTEEGDQELAQAQGETHMGDLRKVEVGGSFSTYNIKLIQADKASMGPQDVTICIADTGVAIGHPDLEAGIFDGDDAEDKFLPGDFATWEWDFDTNGHGTHIAGTVQHILKQAKRNSQNAGSVRIHVTRALSREGRGYEFDVRLALTQCMAAGANIINLSLGSSYISGYQDEFLLQIMEKKNVLVVAGAGNDGTGAQVFPASHGSVISVAAVDGSGKKIALSNSNSQVELAAPGESIASTDVSSSQAVITFSGGKTLPATLIQPGGQVASGTLRECDGDCVGAICLLRTTPGNSLNVLLEKCAKAGGVGAIVLENRRLFEAEEGDAVSQIKYGLSLQGDEEEKEKADDITEDETGGPTAFPTTSPTDAPTVAPKESSAPTAGPTTAPMAGLGKEVTVGDQIAVQYIFAERSGTSMATAHVVAAAAVLWTHFPRCGPAKIRYALAKTARHPDFPKVDCDNDYGYGLIQIEDAVKWLNARGCEEWEVPLSKGGCTTVADS